MSDTAAPQSTAFTTASAVRGEFAHKLPRRRVQAGLLLAVLDIISAELAMSAAAELRSWFDPATFILGLGRPVLDIGISGVFISCLVIANGSMLLYGTEVGGSVERFRRRILAALLVPALALTFIALLQPVTFPIVGLLGVTAGLTVPLGLIGEGCLRKALPDAWNASTLLVGDGAQVARLASHLTARPELGLRPIGFISDNSAGAPISLAWLGRLSDLNESLDGIDVVIIALSASLPTLSPTRLPVPRVVICPDTTTMAGAWFNDQHFGGLAGFEFVNPTLNRRSRRIKRALELCIAAPIALLTLPLVAVTALAIKAISPGPAFYVQWRIGWKGTPVKIYKLRSMYLNADDRLRRYWLQIPKCGGNGNAA